MHADDLVVYQVQVRSFMDSNNDGIGDIPGLSSRLPYIKSLGANVIYLNPVMKARRPFSECDPTKDQFNGYESIGLTEIDPDLGTIEDFIEFISHAHRLGMRVILDFLTIGLSTQHQFFRDVEEDPRSKYRDYFLIRDEVPPGDWLHFEKPPAWRPLRSGGYYYAIWSDWPFLNHRNPAVRDYIFSVADFWLNLGVDGFRLDAAHYVIQNGPGKAQQEHQKETIDYWKAFRSHVTARFGRGKLLVAEILPCPRDVDYIANGDIMDLLYDGVLAEELFSRPEVSLHSLNPDLFHGAFNEVSYSHKLLYMSNHDRGRMASKRGWCESAARLFASLHLLSNGVPIIYYGEEIGLRGPAESVQGWHAACATMAWGDGPCGGFTEGPAPRLTASSDFPVRNVQAQDTDPLSLLNHYRALIQLRRMHPLFTNGVRRSVRHHDKRLLIYFLYGESGVALVIHNLSADLLECELDLSDYLGDEPFSVIFGSDAVKLRLNRGTLHIAVLEAYASAVASFGTIPVDRFRQYWTVPFPVQGRHGNLMVASPSVSGEKNALAVRSDTLPGRVEFFSFHEKSMERCFSASIVTGQTAVVPFSPDTCFCRWSTDLDCRLVAFDWRTYFEEHTAELCRSAANRFLKGLRAGADDDFWYFRLDRGHFAIPNGGGLDFAFLFSDPDAPDTREAFGFWGLPAIHIHRPIDAMIVYQDRAGSEQKPTLYTGVAHSVLPGCKTKDALLYCSDEHAFFMMVKRDELTLPAYQLAVVVWSAGGTWLDAAPALYPIVEVLPHGKEPSRDSIAGFLDIAVTKPKFWIGKAT